MTSTTTPIASTNGLVSGLGIQSQNSASSTSEIISSFKEILSVMSATSGMSSSGQAAGFGMSMSDLMAPLMLIMVERLIERMIDLDAEGTQATASGVVQAQSLASAVTGSKPEPSGRPVEGGRISQQSHPGHTALDFAIPVGTPVKTTMDGKVIHAGWNTQGYGNLVIVENGIYRTYYAHLSSIPVSVGETVRAGTVIGLSGNTGNSTGPHLHYEIRKNKVTIDPTAATLGT